MKKKETINLLLKQLLFNSKIFKPSEIDIIIKRLNGNYVDKCGIFSNKIKPKVLEILMWNNTNFKKLLNKIIKQKINTKKSDIELFILTKKSYNKPIKYSDFNKLQ